MVYNQFFQKTQNFFLALKKRTLYLHLDSRSLPKQERKSHFTPAGRIALICGVGDGLCPRRDTEQKGSDPLQGPA
jgi:hypothetical protein